MKGMKIVPAMLMVGVAVIGSLSGRVNAAAARQDEERSAPGGRHAAAGSWLVTYDIPAFGEPFPLLLSLAGEGTVLETDAPGKFQLAPDFFVILSNGHGAWEPTRGRKAFAYEYRKLIYQQDGLTPFGVTRTSANGSLSPDGATFQVQIAIEIADIAGQVLFQTTGTAAGTKIRVSHD
jgi:hypothetical protein